VKQGSLSISELKSINGIDLLRPLPSEVQKITIFSAGIVVHAEERDEGKSTDWLPCSASTVLRKCLVLGSAFTATPKGKTLELFGRPGGSSKPEAFHTYSMRQAIEEKFILDVLSNYTTYKTFYRFVKQAADDPEVKKKEAVKVIAKMALMHPTNVEQKVAVMVEHFVANVRHRIGGKAKAMVVTYSRLQAVRYKLAFDRYINEKGYKDIHALVAFSGTVHDPETDIDYTEPGMNLDIVTQKGIDSRFLLSVKRRRLSPSQSRVESSPNN
jgi:hypothetical protein